MSSISPDDIRWNDEARAKILDDSDRVLREAVLDVAGSHADGSWEDAFAELNARLKDRFIDFEPGPDLRRYAEAIVGGEIEGVGGGSGGGSADSGAPDSSSSDSSSSDSSSTQGSADDSGAGDDTTSGDGGGAYADRTADQIAADAGLSEPATPETDGSAPDSDAGSSPDSDEASSVLDGNATSDITKTAPSD
jgi:hypothetical protein